MVEARSSAEQGRSDERDRALRSLRQQHSQQVQGFQQIIRSQMNHLTEKDQTIAQNEETIRQQAQQLGEKEREKVGEIDRLQRQLGCINQQLEESERVVAQFQRRIAELEQLRPATDTSSSSKEQRASIKLTWREGGKAPCKTSISYSRAFDGSVLYVKQAGYPDIYSYTTSTSSWSKLSDSPTHSCPSVIINNLLTLVGGLDHRYTLTNQLFSLTGKGSDRRWTEEFSPMPTKRWGSTALCTGTTLIVAGGKGKSTLQTVEVLNTETRQWSTAVNLPKPLFRAPAVISGDQVYILGESNMSTCSVLALIQSRESVPASIRIEKRSVAQVWREVTALPVIETTCVSVHGRLLAIGGKGLDKKPTTAIHMYNPTTDSWEVISHMGTPRYWCIAAVLPNNQLMVVGGYTTGGRETDSVEFAYVE